MNPRDSRDSGLGPFKNNIEASQFADLEKSEKSSLDQSGSQYISLSKLKGPKLVKNHSVINLSKQVTKGFSKLNKLSPLNYS